MTYEKLPHILLEKQRPQLSRESEAVLKTEATVRITPLLHKLHGGA
jgi:hypothetical protein